MTTKTKLRQCPTCCPAARVDFDLNALGTAWLCRNCGHTFPYTPRVSPRLPAEITPATPEITPTQRRILGRLADLFDSGNATAIGCSASVIIVIKAATQWDDAAMFQVGPRGAIRHATWSSRGPWEAVMRLVTGHNA